MIFKSVVMLSMYVAPFVAGWRDRIVEAIKPEGGQDLIEYAALAGFIGIAMALAFIAFPLTGAVETFAGAIYDCVSFSADCGNIGAEEGA